jgi:uncharacterized membrane protein (UPF0127 family)
MEAFRIGTRGRILGAGARRAPFYFHGLALAAALALALAGCGGGADPAKAAAAADAWFPLRVGEARLQVQLALGPEEQRRGLMHREQLDADAGMLFLFPRPGPRSFWMKNTLIPLDLGYFDSAGVLLEVRPLYPHDETGVASAGDRVQIALETNRGWFAAAGLRPGVRLDLGLLEEAVEARGADFAAFGLESARP